MMKSEQQIRTMIDDLMVVLRQKYLRSGLNGVNYGYSYETDPNAEDYKSNVQMLEYFYYREGAEHGNYGE